MTSIDVTSIYTDVPIDATRVIPNQVYQTWKTPFIDPAHARRLAGFRADNPDFGFHFFDDERMSDYMEDAWSGHAILDVFRGTRVGAARADIWRYCILYDRGGIYLDIDASLALRLGDLPKDIGELISYERNRIGDEIAPDVFPQDRRFETPPPGSFLLRPDRIVINWCLMFRPKHPILLNAIETIAHHAPTFRGVRFGNMLQAVLHFSGPLVLTRAVWDHVETGGRFAQMDIDYGGAGIFRLDTAFSLYSSSPHYSKESGKAILE